MEESNSHDGEELITRRLIKQAEADTLAAGLATPVKSGIPPIDRGGDSSKEKSVAIPADEPADNSLNGGNAENAISSNASSVAVAHETQTAFAKVEKSLMSIGFFTPSSRRIKEQKVKRISFTRTVDGKKVEATVEFHPSAVLGLPITADQDKFLALHDIITRELQSKGKITNPIRFTSADLLRLLNKRVRTGKNYKDISEWLDVMSATTIFSTGVVYEAGKQRFARDRFHVFDRAVSVGKEMPDGSIADANFVWLSEWQLENINQNFLLPIDLRTYRELKNHIAKALVPLLQVWLYASQRAGLFEKRYDELCEMLSLQIYKQPSLIVRQLRPSLDELVRYEYLEKWKIEKTADAKAYKIIFFHGSKFHRDRRRRLDQKAQAEQPAVLIAQSEPEMPEPGKLESATPAASEAALRNRQASAAPAASIETEGREDRDGELVDELSARGIMPSVALKLISTMAPEKLADIGDYIDYWDSIPAAKRGTGLLVKLIQNGDPLPASVETRKQREKKRADAERRRKFQSLKNALTTAYQDYREGVLDRFIQEQITPDEFDRQVALQKKETSTQSELWNRRPSPAVMDHVARQAVRAQIAKGVTVLPYEEFRNRELPKILTELQIDPTELGIELPSGAPTG